MVLINQKLAMVGGITLGDAPGFPVTITVPGSYRLSGNLSVPDENTTGIVIQSLSPGEVGNVTVDLNGFAIRGVTVCTGFGSDTVCAPKGTGLQAAQRPLRAGLVGWHSAADAQVEVLPHEKAMSP